MSEGRGDKSASRSRSLGVMEGKGFYSKHSKPRCRPSRRRQKAPCRRFALSHGANSMPLLACNSAHEVESLEL
jgi:hypothetical protein